MGTFHDDHDELHGLTVAIFSNSTRTYIGRWDKKEEGYVRIVGANYHEEGENPESRDAWLTHQKTYGLEVKYPTLTIPEGEVTRVVQLREVVIDGK